MFIRFPEGCAGCEGWPWWKWTVEVDMRAFLTRPLIRWSIGVGLVAGAAVAWYLVSPLFITNEVNDEFPMAATAQVPDYMTRAEVEAEMIKAADVPAVEASEGMPAGAPTALASGTFEDADTFHKGTGMATLYELEDGSAVLRLEDFKVTNGPDLHVLLSTSDDPADDLGGYIDLGSLKGNVGNQNYPLSAEVDISQYRSVVIYCEPFHVLFSSARLGT